jgi:hypothetical protein
MARKRRSKEQIAVDKIIKKQLAVIADEILKEAVPSSRRDTGRLQDEMNYEFEGDTTLVLSQMEYGAFNYPAGKNSGEKNALLIAVNNNIPKATKIIIKNINDSLLKPFKK